ncbi:DUF402 domain-containing protein [Shimazuella kribbensis]|uniref:DUF402 domain-containing protein n=1 Tax=Shimazuella kribbensis TaxID=139808 RepID=UPI000409D2E7|nr:DUF402 domain-containing protein [Shimazuella kribbensis]
MTKRKYADRPNWKRVKDKIFFIRDDPDFVGKITCLGFKSIEKPLWKQYTQTKLKILDNHYWWIQFFPSQKNYTITLMVNEEKQIIQWYIDICKTQGIGETGIPWFDDLYLDIVILPTGHIEILDLEDLKIANLNHLISDKDYHLAIQTMNALISSIEKTIEFYQALYVKIKPTIISHFL